MVVRVTLCEAASSLIVAIGSLGDGQLLKVCYLGHGVGALDGDRLSG